MISAIIFDCDGVLVDSEVLAHEVEIAVLAEIGLDYEPRGFKARFMGMSDKTFHAALEADGQARLGRSILADIAPRMKARTAEAVRRRLVAIAGVHAAVAAVRQAKAVASSSTAEELEIKLKMTGLWDQFAPHIYSAQDVTHSKPAPDLFLLAAGRLGSARTRCLVIEDSVNGVTAARAAGMRVWGFMGGGHMDDDARKRLEASGAERIVENWAEALLLFGTL
jgi:HAD superfamily hydrolase (TIGR01509 family)